MKRKKWSEQEEQTLLSKYSELLRSGTLAKLKTREKKFKPVADHVNALHHHRDPATFPFTWSWRDVSIKVQNMRHQYLGVKQKIRALSSPHSFNWSDGLNHWENFLHYKEVFGDIPSATSKPPGSNSVALRNLGFSASDDDDDDDDGDEEEEECECEDEFEVDSGEEMRRLGEIGVRVLELREAVAKREERRREREFRREKEEAAAEREREKRRKREWEREEGELELGLELEERRLRWARREVARRARLERELEEERRRRKRAEERMEEEEMEWRERMVAMQVEHEKQMMQMHVDACQNQMQILGIMARILCQFFGSGSDGLGGGGSSGGLGGLPPQVLQNLQHNGELGNVKPDANSPSEFM